MKMPATARSRATDATGCVDATDLACNDNDACNGVERATLRTGCVAATDLACNDNNACNGVETCDRATGLR